MSTITIQGRCHCDHISYAHEVTRDAFPLKSSICHCTTCRKTTGQVIVSWAVLPLQPDVSKLIGYKSSSTLTRYFCPTCGASVYNHEQVSDHEEEWDFATGLWNKTEDLLNRVELWVGDTSDGGLSPWLKVDEKHVEDRQSSSEVTFDSSGPTETKHLSASCRCGDIRFQISRPKAPTGTFEAYVDTCESCRRATGFEMAAWVDIPRRLLSPALSELKGLQCYQSSHGIWRDFCGRCGAKVFWRRDPEVFGWKGDIDDAPISVAPGLLDAPDGVRAESWLNWSHIAFIGEAMDQDLAQGLVDGMNRDREREQGG